MSSKKEERLWTEKLNKWGDLMKIVEYNSANDMVVEFQDEWKEKKRCGYKEFNNGNIINPHTYKQRLGTTALNNQGCVMKVVEYIDSSNVIIEFQDEYHERVKCDWSVFIRGNIKNHYAPFACGVGMIGTKYPAVIDGKKTKEYTAWNSMLTRCYTTTIANGINHYPWYENISVCKEWLLYENFYEWLHAQENFDSWVLLNNGQVDKDILIKGNIVYSPDTCLLVPHSINTLFIKSNKTRGKYPIGVTYKTRDKVFEAQCNINGKETYIGRFNDSYKAFLAYKNFKEQLIKQTAQKEFDKGNITKKCYDAMMEYKVEITD